MTPEESLKHFETTVGTWIDSLGHYTAEQFSRRPDENQWSIGQVYNHILRGAHNFQLGMIDQCVSGTAEKTDEEMAPPGKAIFGQGAFPAEQITVPGAAQSMPHPDSIESVHDGLQSLLTKMQENAPAIAAADPTRKARHPFLGMLNAAEWYQLIGMHFAHHLRQKSRLDEWLGVGKADRAAPLTT